MASRFRPSLPRNFGLADRRHRLALTAVVTRYRARGSELGKALGPPRDLTKMLTGLVWGWSAEGISDEQIAALNLNAHDHRLKLTRNLAAS